ncbi:MAG: biopolymer transporter ExbD [Bacteroidales bacterium]|nr:biopolymer transporter ExbD [Bacteroidales bacterium]
MKISRSRRSSAEVYTASLNDIMFFLLLFFLIISTMVNPSVVKVLLPRASSSEPSMAQDNVNLTITQDHKYYVNNREVSFQEIEPILSEQAQKLGGEFTVFLRADNSLTIQSVIDVIDIGNRLKIKMVLSTKKFDTN